MTAGIPFDVTVTALDPYGNAALNYQGTVHFSTSDTGPGFVLPGDYVQQGQIVGFSGDTGFSTGPHLHFEVRLDGTPVDPLRLLPLR